MANHTPLALTAITRSHSVASTSARRPLWPIPAVTVTSPGTPIRPMVAATAASTWSVSVISQRMSASPTRSHTTTSTRAAR